MKPDDEKKDDASSLTVEERRQKFNAVLKELLQVVPPMAPDDESEREPGKTSKP